MLLRVFPKTAAPCAASATPKTATPTPAPGMTAPTPVAAAGAVTKASVPPASAAVPPCTISNMPWTSAPMCPMACPSSLPCTGPAAPLSFAQALIAPAAVSFMSCATEDCSCGGGVLAALAWAGVAAPLSLVTPPPAQPPFSTPPPEQGT